MLESVRVLESVRGITQYNRVLLSVTEYCRVLQSIAEIRYYYRVLQSVREC